MNTSSNSKAIQGKIIEKTDHAMQTKECVRKWRYIWAKNTPFNNLILKHRTFYCWWQWTLLFSGRMQLKETNVNLPSTLEWKKEKKSSFDEFCKVTDWYLPHIQLHVFLFLCSFTNYHLRCLCLCNMSFSTFIQTFKCHVTSTINITNHQPHGHQHLHLNIITRTSYLALSCFTAIQLTILLSPLPQPPPPPHQ